jgi:hypothetical protein
MISIIPFIIQAHLGIDKVCLCWPFFHAPLTSFFFWFVLSIRVHVMEGFGLDSGVREVVSTLVLNLLSGTKSNLFDRNSANARDSREI